MEWGKIESLLTTKFRPPHLPDDLVVREALTERLLDNLEKPLLLVSSASGSGKSLFVSSCLERIPFPVAWVSLDGGDSDLRTFFSYFVTALRRLQPSFGERTLPVLAAFHLPPADELARTLINDLNSLTTPLLLVLDDLHLVRNDEVFAILAAMLEFPPPAFRLLIISREDPPLPLERLQAKNKLFRIGPSELRMTHGEIRAFVARHFSGEDLEALVDILERKTEGWATGLRLAMLHPSLRNNDLQAGIRLLEESDLTGNYFLEEVLKDLEPALTDLLLRTSLPDRFSPSLADHLLGRSLQGGASRSSIDRIVRANLFVSPLDEQGRWYRYHHLFQEFLRKELEQRYSREEIHTLHERCVEWFEANGLLDEAFHHAAAIGAYDRMADMIETHMDHPLNEDKWYVLDDWLGRLPEEHLHRRPGLMVARMWVMHNKATWLIPDLLAEFDRRWKEQEVDASVAVQVRFFRGVVQYWGNRFREALANFEYVRKNLPREKIGAISINNYYYLTASHINGVGDKALREIGKILLNESLDPFYRAMLLGGIAYVRMLEGDLGEVLELSRRIYDTGITLHNPFLQVWGAYLSGMAAFYRNEMEEALAWFDRTRDNIYMLNLLGPLDCYAGHALTLLTLGKKKKLHDLLERMEEFVRRRVNPAMETFHNSFRVRLALLNGDLEQAGRNMSRVNMFFESGNLFFWIETPRVTRIKYLLAMGEAAALHEAAQLATATLTLARRTRNVPQQIQLEVLQAVILARQGKKEEALTLLTTALTQACPGGWVRPFFEGGDEVMTLMQALKPPAAGEGFRKTILQHFRRYPAAGKMPFPFSPREEAKEPEMWTLLTNRELDVLDLLAQRLTNKEIAARLFISEATVKRHTITIYRKLGVGKRQEAVARARQMGLIPSTRKPS